MKHSNHTPYLHEEYFQEFIVVNKHLLHDLVERGLWNENLKQELMRNNGSVQALNIPQDFERIVQNCLGNVMKDIDMSRQRGYFCRSITIVELIYAKCQLF
jgi:hypothetical protein